jgi:hypothetical protein
MSGYFALLATKVQGPGIYAAPTLLPRPSQRFERSPSIEGAGSAMPSRFDSASGFETANAWNASNIGSFHSPAGNDESASSFQKTPTVSQPASAIHEPGSDGRAIPRSPIDPFGLSAEAWGRLQAWATIVQDRPTSPLHANGHETYASANENRAGSALPSGQPPVLSSALLGLQDQGESEAYHPAIAYRKGRSEKAVAAHFVAPEKVGSEAIPQHLALANRLENVQDAMAKSEDAQGQQGKTRRPARRDERTLLPNANPARDVAGKDGVFAQASHAKPSLQKPGASVPVAPLPSIHVEIGRVIIEAPREVKATPRVMPFSATARDAGLRSLQDILARGSA